MSQTWSSLEEVPRVRERTCVVLHLDGGLCTGLSRPRGPVFQQSHGLLVDLAICPLLWAGCESPVITALLSQPPLCSTKNCFLYSDASILGSFWWCVGSRARGTVVVVHGLSCSVACGVCWDRDWNCLPCLARQILNHWTTKEVPAVMSSRWIGPFIIIYNKVHLCPLLPFWLEVACLIWVELHAVSFGCAWGFMFRPFLLSLFVCRAEMSLRRLHIVGFCVLIHPGTLCHFTSEFDPFIFRVIFGKWGLRTAIFLLFYGCAISPLGLSW